MNKPVYLTRRVVFSSSHRLYANSLSEEENFNIFHKCSYENGHGHNYVLTVTLKGVPDPITGMLINLVELKEIIQKYVLDDFDHRHLNKDVEEFKKLNPTVEIMAIVIWERLSPHISNLYEVHLKETENNFAYYKGPE